MVLALPCNGVLATPKVANFATASTFRNVQACAKSSHKCHIVLFFVEHRQQAPQSHSCRKHTSNSQYECDFNDVGELSSLPVITASQQYIITMAWSVLYTGSQFLSTRNITSSESVSRPRRRHAQCESFGQCQLHRLVQEPWGL